MMSGMLSQVNWEQAGVFAGVLIAGLGGQKGLEALILAWRGRRGPTANTKYYRIEVTNGTVTATDLTD